MRTLPRGARALLAACVASAGAVLAAPPPLEWDPADHGGDMVAVAKTLTRYPPFGSPWQTARSRTSQSAGLRTVHVAIDTPGLGVAVGVANARASVGAGLGDDGDSVAYWSIGATRVNGAFGVSLPPFGPGDVIGIQADLDANTVRFQKNAGEWSAALPIASLGPDVYIAASMYVGDAGAATLRIADDDWNDFAQPTVNIVAVGDSVTLNGGVLRSYVQRLKDELSASRKHLAQVKQFAANGASWNYAWSAGGYPNTLLQDGPVRVDWARSQLPNWLVLFAGTNGITLGGHSPLEEYASLQDYVRARVAAGWRASQIIVCTMLPRAGISEAVRSSYNALIVADGGGLGYRVARLDRDVTLETLNATNYPDGTHPSDALHARIARIVADLIPAAESGNPFARK